MRIICSLILYNLKTRTLVLLMSGRSDVLVAAEQDKHRPKILQVLKEIAPEVNHELILQQLSRKETDGLVDCSVEVARKYRELEKENENYRKRKDTFVTLYQEEQDRIRELEVKLAEVEKEMNEMRGKCGICDTMKTNKPPLPQNTGPSTVIPLLLTVLLMSGRSDVPVATVQDKYRPKILQVLKW